MAAKQRGDRKLKGSIGDITYSRRKNGTWSAYEKVESNAKKIASHPDFLLIRQNNTEFGRAGAAGKLFRDAIRSKMKMTTDSGASPRLLKTLLRIIKEDPVSDRGERKLSNGPIEMLEGFDFNETAPLSIVLPAPFTTTIDRVTGSLKLDIPGFIPARLMKTPPGATHFKIIATALELDFDSGQFVADAKYSSDLPCNNDSTADIVLVTTVTPGSTKPLFQLMALEFSQLINGKYYQMATKNVNALKVVKVAS